MSGIVSLVSVARSQVEMGTVAESQTVHWYGVKLMFMII